MSKTIVDRDFRGKPYRLREDVVQCWSEGLFSVLTDPRNAAAVRYIVGDRQMVLFKDAP